MSSILEFLKGKKAYIVGLLSIILGIMQGDQNLILSGLGVLTLRAGIAKIGT